MRFSKHLLCIAATCFSLGVGSFVQAGAPARSDERPLPPHSVLNERALRFEVTRPGNPEKPVQNAYLRKSHGDLTTELTKRLSRQDPLVVHADTLEKGAPQFPQPLSSKVQSEKVMVGVTNDTIVLQKGREQHVIKLETSEAVTLSDPAFAQALKLLPIVMHAQVGYPRAVAKRDENSWSVDIGGDWIPLRMDRTTRREGSGGVKYRPQVEVRMLARQGSGAGTI